MESWSPERCENVKTQVRSIPWDFWETGKYEQFVEENGCVQGPDCVQFEEREIGSEEQVKRLVASISSVFIVNKHYTYKDDAHPWRPVVVHRNHP